MAVGWTSEWKGCGYVRKDSLSSGALNDLAFSNTERAKDSEKSANTHNLVSKKFDLVFCPEAAARRAAGQSCRSPSPIIREKLSYRGRGAQPNNLLNLLNLINLIKINFTIYVGVRMSFIRREDALRV